jgi:hypothetical protein
MTDLQAFKKLYGRFGINLVEKKEQGKIFIEFGSCSENNHEKLTGYLGFYSRVTFNLEGKFINQGFYE